jgi:hypothetical protein
VIFAQKDTIFSRAAIARKKKMMGEDLRAIASRGKLITQVLF